MAVTICCASSSVSGKVSVVRCVRFWLSRKSSQLARSRTVANVRMIDVIFFMIMPSIRI